MPKMNPDIKAQWLSALRSGEYTQGKRVLHQIDPTGETYCCLGVLCDLAVQAGVVTAKKPGVNGAVIYGTDEYTILPMEVVEWAGLDYTVPLVPVENMAPQHQWTVEKNGGGVKLSHLNDTENWDFHRIAAAIERYL